MTVIKCGITEEGFLRMPGEWQAEEAYAELELRADNSLCLIRWPRTTSRVHLPEAVDGHPLTGIAPLAFAAFHMKEDIWPEFRSGYSRSFSVFCLTHGKSIRYEDRDSGGPVEVTIPDTVTEIGQYAFWQCGRLRSVSLPAGLRQIPDGCFGECSCLEQVKLPDALEEIGSMLPQNVHAMPDMGAFSGCHRLKRIELPGSLRLIGAETFNSCGIEEVLWDAEGHKVRVQVHPTAFAHTAALQWMSYRERGRILWQIGLPAARDKILTCDERYRGIARLPYLFFARDVCALDLYAREAFRLDFTGRMAIARLRHPGLLQAEMRDYYMHVLIEYFDRTSQFWPESPDCFAESFDLLRGTEGFDAEMLSELMRIAGYAHLDMDLICEMAAYRNQNFSTVTGLECLEL